ncbi:MAG TPA: hypothetical protein VHA11_14755 [Bryobacteraceae bacterium]|nr:hypothetical protein [Bryobacteraceae bacterium]
MRRALLILGVVLFAAGANAQWRRFGDDDYGRGRDYRIGARPGVVERALRDVDSARPYRGGGHWRELEKARRDLLRFTDRWYEGRFDKDRLDGAIEHIDHALRSNALDRRDRYVLERDLWDLRSFRENRGRGFDRGWRRGPEW